MPNLFFCVDQFCFLLNVHNVAQNLPVWARLNQFWKTEAAVGASPKVIRALKEGILPFWNQPILTSSPVIISGYVNPLRASYLMEALHALIQKNAVEKVTNFGFFRSLFLVPKSNNKWRPLLDLSSLNKSLKSETIRTSLQTGDSVTSIDFKDACFHIPINTQSRKYLRFHIQDQSYQFKALPFGLSIAPMEFTVVAKEIKSIALQKSKRIHQYLDDWLVRGRSHQTCLQQTLVALCQELCWIVNLEKSELEPKQVFNFLGYQFHLKESKVRPLIQRYKNWCQNRPVRSGI